THATPLFLVLILIEFTDLVFALDSIPAVIAVTQNEFIVYTSNVFAILGLRALYFALGGIMNSFEYLSYGLAVVLMYVGVKMLISEYYKVPTLTSLGIIAFLITVSILASLLFPSKKQAG
ncbi:MAG: TerC family protein, partial [Candidatus Sumerlaeia bacterium]|nr:TerC family protein [Candidatus Sumerlaeia bacterium]